MPISGALTAPGLLAPILLHVLTEFSNSTDLPNEGLAPIPQRQALPDIDRLANDGAPCE
jgi:hypothetical protein